MKKYTVSCFKWNSTSQDYNIQTSIYDPEIDADEWLETKNQYKTKDGNFEYSIFNENNEFVDSFTTNQTYIF